MNDGSAKVKMTSEESSDLAATQLTATAYHEAGHAVMAMVLGRSVQKVTVLPRNTAGGIRLGICEMQKSRVKGSKTLVDDEVLVLFAGMVAEARYTGQYCPDGALQDLRSIKRLLLHRTRDERQLQRVQQRLLAKAEHLLGSEGHALAIELIAGELLEKGTVSGRAVRHFFDLALKQSS